MAGACMRLYNQNLTDPDKGGWQWTSRWRVSMLQQIFQHPENIRKTPKHQALMPCKSVLPCQSGHTEGIYNHFLDGWFVSMFVFQGIFKVTFNCISVICLHKWIMKIYDEKNTPHQSNLYSYNSCRLLGNTESIFSKLQLLVHHLWSSGWVHTYEHMANTNWIPFITERTQS